MTSAKTVKAGNIRRNPYFHRGSIKPDKQQYFFGRRRQIRLVLDALAEGQSVSISGPRRIGKTSLLYHILSTAVQERYDLDDRYLFVYADCQGMQGAMQSAVYWLLREEVADSLKAASGDCQMDIDAILASSGALADPEETFDLRHLVELARVLSTHFSEEELRTLCFKLSIEYEDLEARGKAHKARELVSYCGRRRIVPKLVDVVDLARPGVLNGFHLPTGEGRAGASFKKLIQWATDHGFRVVLLFDEFESLAGNRSLESDFFGHLRSLSNRYKVTYVTASHNPLYELMGQHRATLGSSFFGDFHRMHLGLMELDEAKSLTNGPALLEGQEGFSNSEITFLLDIAGLHPFFLQMACYHLFQEKTESAAPNRERARRRYIREAEGHFHHAWSHLGDEEKTLLRELAVGSSLSLPRPRRDALVHKCLISDRGSLFSSVFAEFVRSQTTSLPEHERTRTTINVSLTYELGLERMKERLDPMRTDVFLDFTTLEQRLLENLNDERQFGFGGSSQVQRARIVRELNRLAHNQLGTSFNDLCRSNRAGDLQGA